MTSNNAPSDLISVCICTYKRPQMLEHAIKCVLAQATKSEFSLEIVIIDNDKHRSAESTVQSLKVISTFKITYDCEPEQNISLSRNRAIRNSNGAFIAFIDDDEYPDKNWIGSLFNAITEYQVDGVIGPVLPYYPPGAPQWLIMSGLCDRGRNKTGSIITKNDMRTGNILLKREIFQEDQEWFNRSKGLTGGEDGEFIGRQINNGKLFIWCDEAIVFETVIEARWKASFYLRKMARIGTLSGERLRRDQSYSIITRTFILTICYFTILPFAMLTKKYIWMKPMSKFFYYFGRVLGILGINHFRSRQ